jgi:uncharacterized SAM-binding protein YcdF (DUF218 family)
LTAAGRALVEDDGPRKEQAALVLGGDSRGTRLLVAARLAQNGYAPYVLVSGPAAFGRHECDFTIQEAVAAGFTASLFRAVPNESNSTRSEAQFFRTYLKNHDIRSILLVTSNFHTRRAAWIFRKIMPGVVVDVVAAPDPLFSPEDWWRNRDGQKTFLLEWTKTVATRLGF